MIDGNRDNNVFRFMHLRPGKARRDQPQPIMRRAPRARARASSSPAAVSSNATLAPSAPTPEVLVSVKRELERIDLARDLNLPGPRGSSAGMTLLSLNSQGVSRLSATSKAVFEPLGVSPASTRLDELVEKLDAALTTVRKPGRGPIPGPNPNPAPALLRAVGVADLLVVKQQIKRYEAGEIAHIENLLAGESKVRTHRQLDRMEEFLSTVQETEHEKETRSVNAQ